MTDAPKSELSTECVDADFRDTWQLATPWERIKACAINHLLALGLILLPAAIVGVGLSPINSKVLNSIGAACSALLFLAYMIYQLMLIHRDSQSYGKKVLKLKVVNAQGEKLNSYAIFWRELPLQIAFWGLMWVPILGLLFNVILWGGMFYLLFSKAKNHRTWQDQLADSWVVKA